MSFSPQITDGNEQIKDKIEGYKKRYKRKNNWQLKDILNPKTYNYNPYKKKPNKDK